MPVGYQIDARSRGDYDKNFIISDNNQRIGELYIFCRTSLLNVY